MRELTLNECTNVDGGLSNLGTVLYSTGIGTGLGTLAGLGFSNSGMLAPIIGGAIGCSIGAGIGFTIVFGAAIIKFAGSETSL